MMISEHTYVWIWLPNKPTPIVTGKLELTNHIYRFNYGQSYLNNPEAIALYEQELPLRQGLIEPINGLQLASCLRDGGPDAWGRRVILNTVFSSNKQSLNRDLNEIDYFLLSGSDRIGALDFQRSPEHYEARNVVFTISI